MASKRPVPQGLVQWGIAIALFLVVSVGYFWPLFQGKALPSSDTISVEGMQQNLTEYEQQYGEPAYWSTSMFGGMPSYTIGSHHKGNWVSDLSDTLERVLPYPVLSFFLGLLLAFGLLRALKVHWLLALAGALGFCFFSYHVILFEAGHISKLRALLYAPGVLLGVILTLRGKYILGAALTAFTVALELNANHVQMTYYLFFIILAIVIADSVRAIREKQVKQLLIAGLLLATAAGIGVAANATRLLPLMEYTDKSIRGPSELSVPVDQLIGGAPAAAQPTGDEPEPGSAGLTRSYAFNWSNGRVELFTLLIPNFHGGGSMGELESGNKLEEAFRQVDPSGQAYNQFFQQNRGRFPAYWGSQPFTSGPVYLGAVLVFFFVIGLMLVKGGIKWALLYSALLLLMLSLGSHSFTIFEAIIILLLPVVYALLENKVKFPKAALGVGLTLLGFVIVWVLDTDPSDPNAPGQFLFTDLFFKYLPLYNRFRAPASITMLLACVVPLLALLGAQRLLDKDVDSDAKKRAVLYALGLIGGVCVIFALMPGAFFNFMTEQERQAIASNANYSILYEGMAAMRKSLMTKDALRSLFFVAAAAGLSFALVRGWMKSSIGFGAGLILLISIDLIGVSTRYVSWSDFVPQATYQQNFQPRQADSYLAARMDTLHQYARVFPLNRNPFNDGATPYHLMSVGGYNAAKVRRYQELADVYLQNPANRTQPYGITTQVVNMLNMQYLILPAENAQGGVHPQYELLGTTQQGEAVLNNRQNLGPAWIVRNVKVVPIPDSALVGLYGINTAETAIIEARQQPDLATFSSDTLSLGEEVKLTDANNMQMKYSFKSDKARFVVFSEVYYDGGWVATIDGQPAPILQTNYVLRGLVVPAGQHEIVFRFEPQTVANGASISLVASILIFLGLAAAGALAFLQWRKKEQQPISSEA